MTRHKRDATGATPLRQSTALLLSACLSIAAALVVAAAAFLLGGRLGIWQWLFYAGALLTVIAALYPFRQATWGSRRWMRGLLGRTRAPQEEDADPESLPVLPNELASLFEERLQQVERRERELGDRLASYHQWFEFPPPLDLAEVERPTQDTLERDRQLDKLLEERTQDLYEKIRQNAYSHEGKFQFTLARDDIYELAGQIASLYGNDPDRPLAGVSSERVLRAAGRCCLKFLVELEKLPLDIRGYDIVDIYGYVRQAVNVYGLYRSARRYMPWLRGAYYGTWIAMGANPLALGAWWFVSSMGTKGASTVATNIANRWALSFLHDIVRVIGYEVASVYDPSLRYRDPNWCFAAELTELVQTFPDSEQSLRRALSLIGALQLRNEYDRIYFFRCVVEGKRAELKRSHAADLLPEQRREIAERLEGFLNSHIPDPNPKTLERWQAGVEERLDIALTVDGPEIARPEDEQRRAAVRSLAGYLLEIKQIDQQQLRLLLEKTTLVAAMDEEEAADLWKTLEDDPPFFFQAPEIVPSGTIAKDFLRDFVGLAAGVAPRYPVADEIVLATAVRLRCDAGDTRKRLDSQYIAELARRLPDDAPNRRVPADVARAALDLLQEHEPLRFIYDDVEVIDLQHDNRPEVQRGRTWLLGMGNRLVAFTIGDTPEAIWEGDAKVRLDFLKGRIRSDCRLTGGHWLDATTDNTPTLFLRGTVLGSSKKYFAPLLTFSQKATPH